MKYKELIKMLYNDTLECKNDQDVENIEKRVDELDKYFEEHTNQ